MATNMRFYYDAAIAVALASALALVVALLVAVIVGREGPSLFVGGIVLVLTGPLLLWRFWHGWQKGHENGHRR